MRKPYFLITLIYLSFSLVFSGCNTDNRSQEGTTDTEQVRIGTEDLESESRSLMEVIQSREELSEFQDLVESARMAETMHAVGPYTVFAPSNEAFNKLPEGRLNEIRSLNIQRLKTVVGHHMMSRRLMQADVEKGTMVDVLGGKDLPLRMENGNIIVGNARVVTQSIPARNGVIHIIDQVLVPDQEDIEAPAPQQQ